MHLVIVLSAAFLLQSASTTHPADFTGSWKMVAARSESPQQTPPVTEMTFVIEQGVEQIRVDMTSGPNKAVSVLFPIVKPPKAPADPPAGDEKRAYWEGNRLVTERGVVISGQTVSSKQTMSLSPDRSEMIVERLVIVQHGYTLRGSKNYASVKDVFVRVAP
ncbi:MAG TPA: hypothetical protein VJ691_12380 [Vicinamibacterales bacterium]|nr:hypothetical protein [Vicinamibacterales bacterium]